MAKTKQDLATQSLRDMGVIAADETPSNSEAEDMKSRYASLLLELEEEGIGYWPENEIPEVVFHNLSKVLASEAAIAYGVEYNPGDAFTRLQRHAAKPFNGETVKGEYY